MFDKVEDISDAFEMWRRVSNVNMCEDAQAELHFYCTNFSIRRSTIFKNTFNFFYFFNNQTRLHKCCPHFAAGDAGEVDFFKTFFEVYKKFLKKL